MTPKIVWLGHEHCHNSKHVGPKAAHCSQLFAHFNVPAGFCITAMEAPLQNDELQIESPFSPEIKTDILAAYQSLSEQFQIANLIVSVRSSCIDEDREATSFAGQHDTYLNIAGSAAVLEAVEKCWASARNEPALFYRKFHQLSTSRVRIAVIVQQFIAADTAAVAFSINPVTGNEQEIIINANLGLGPSIVDGSTTPDTYIVDKHNLAHISDHQLHKKTIMTVPDAGSGVKNVTIPKFLRTKPALSDAQITEIAATALDLEQQKGYAVDIECAFKSDTLYLLQCRPVSTTE